MTPALILTCIATYFGLLLCIAWFTSRGATNKSYFLANNSAPCVTSLYFLLTLSE